MIKKRALSFFLILLMITQLLTGCNSNAEKEDKISSGVLITETTIEEEFIQEEQISEAYFDEENIADNLVLEDGIYEYIVDDNIIGECICFEITISEKAEEEILKQLPEEIEDYDINWPAVIGKFTVGTTIIVATGVVGYYCPSTYYVMATPLEVGKEALVGGAISAAIEVGINEIKTGGNLSSEGIKKYAIEGFADGYMWGAISSVFRIASKNFTKPHSLKAKGGEVLKIALDGSVTDSAGKELGKAYCSKLGVYVVDKSSTTLYDFSGNLIAEKVPLAADDVLCRGEDALREICLTDSNGKIYAIDGKLLKNTTYCLDNAVYKTDSIGRISKVTFEKLELKKGKKIVGNTIQDIGRGFEKAGDQQGHIIGRRFNGNNTFANLVPMSKEANNSGFKRIENEWARAIENGKNVSGSIEFKYSKKSFRPDKFTVVYDIGEGVITETIIN